MTDRKQQRPAETGRADAEKIGGVAHQHPDWGKQRPAEDRCSDADEDRSGTPKRSP